MRRRDLIAGLGGAALCPLAVRSQQAATLPIVGFLGTSTPSAWSDFVTAFVERLRELGWIEDRTIRIEYRWAEGRRERYNEIAAEFVGLPVNVIVTSGEAASVVKQATSAIPIVFAVANDPLGMGLVASLAHPGGNLTGLSNQASDLSAKRLQLLREFVPSLRILAVMANASYPAAKQEMDNLKSLARASGLEIVGLEIRRAEDIEPALNEIKDRAHALYVVSEPLVAANQILINKLALAARLPTMHSLRDYVRTGGLMSYGPSYPVLFRRAAEFVDKILHGTKPADIPVEQPTRFELVLSLKAATALGLTVPQAIIARADEVIE